MSEGKIYRFLEVGETILPGDEYWNHSPTGWFRSHAGKVTARHNPHRRLETIPAWPIPRDTKTDPPTERDADGGGCVLEWIQTGAFWGRVAWVSVSPFGIWLPLPPPPTPPKSAAEVAWDEHCNAEMPLVKNYQFAKEKFIAGYIAGQKGAKK